MKNNGYTLVELIMTIGLLAAASTIILVNMVGIQGNQEQERQNRFKKTIADAACTYIDMSANSTFRRNCKSSGSCTVNLSTLLSKNYALIDLDYKDPETNCTTQQEQSRVYVQITFSGNPKVKKCEFKRSSKVNC